MREAGPGLLRLPSGRRSRRWNGGSRPENSTTSGQRRVFFINEEIVHGIPIDRVVRAGVLVTLDYGAVVDDYNSDYAVTKVVGTSTDAKDDLIDTKRGSLVKGIEVGRPGNRVGDMSSAIEGHAAPRPFELVGEYVGYGMGKDLHERPQVPNLGPSG